MGAEPALNQQVIHHSVAGLQLPLRCSAQTMSRRIVEDDAGGVADSSDDGGDETGAN